MKYRFCRNCLHRNYCTRCNDPPEPKIKYCSRSFEDLEKEFMAYWSQFNPQSGEKYEPHPRKGN